MFAHHDLVLFQINFLGRKILVTYAKDDSLFTRLGRFRRKVVEVDAAVAVAVHTQPTIAYRNLLRLRVEAILNQSWFPLEVNRSLSKGLFRLQQQGLAFLQLVPLHPFEILNEYRITLEQRILEWEFDGRLKDVGITFLFVNKRKLFAVGHHAIEINVGIEKWRFIFSFDQQCQYRGLIARRIVKTAGGDIGAGFKR